MIYTYYVSKGDFMEKLKITNIQNNTYTLENEQTYLTYKFELKFFDLPNQLKVGDIIGMHKQLLNPNYVEYSTIYYFGSLDAPYGRKVKSKEDIDVIGIKTNCETIFLKRFFG